MATSMKATPTSINKPTASAKSSTRMATAMKVIGTMDANKEKASTARNKLQRFKVNGTMVNL